MAATITNAPAELTVSGLTMRGVVALVTAAVATARARAQARRDYRRLLDDDALRCDVGVGERLANLFAADAGGWD